MKTSQFSERLRIGAEKAKNQTIENQQVIRRPKSAGKKMFNIAVDPDE